MKRFLFFAILFGFLLSVPVTASAQSQTAPISPALQILSQSAELSCHAVIPSDVVFSAEDFDKTFGICVSSVTVTSLPPAVDGTLALGSVAVLSGQSINRDSLDELRFIPQGNCTETSFTFTSDSLSYPYNVRCSLYFLNESNYAPTCAGLQDGYCSLSTYENLPLYGRLRADDPENDPLKYEVVSRPEHGKIRLTDRENGTFCYTPDDGYCGKDRFVYTAADPYGNVSEEKTVDIEVMENTAQITFSDMDKNEAYAAAVTMAKSGIMQGKLTDGRVLFDPMAQVTRAEFVTMAMKANGYTVIGYKITGFADDAAIDQNCRGYVAAAADLGFIQTEGDDVLPCFYPDRPITRAEASQILQAMSMLPSTASHTVFSDMNEVPDSATQSLPALCELGPIPGFASDTLQPNEALTRAQAALILSYIIG